MGGAAVYIATTDGPSRVLRLIEAPYQRHSAACLNFKPRKLPISSAYHEFVSFDGGVVAAETGREQYRLDVSKVIDDGESWQLGAFIAHAFGHAHNLASATAEAPDDTTGAEWVIWATGALDADLSVKTVDHIERKLALSEPLFEKVSDQGLPLLVVMPASSRTEALNTRLNALKERFSGFDFRFEQNVSFDLGHWLKKGLTVKTSNQPVETQSGVKESIFGSLRKRQIAALSGVAAAALIIGAVVYDNRPIAEISPQLPFAAGVASAASGADSSTGLEVFFTAMVSPAGKCFSTTEAHKESPQLISWNTNATAVLNGKLCNLIIDIQNSRSEAAAIVVSEQETGEILYESRAVAGARMRERLPAYLFTGDASVVSISFEAEIESKRYASVLVLTKIGSFSTSTQ